MSKDKMNLFEREGFEASAKAVAERHRIKHPGSYSVSIDFTVLQNGALALDGGRISLLAETKTPRQRFQ